MSKDKELREIIKEVKECQKAYVNVMQEREVLCVCPTYKINKTPDVLLRTDFFFESFTDYTIKKTGDETFPFEASTTKKDIKFLTLLSPEEFEEHCPEAEVID